jgi:LPPG:FO 2-phospho-L-lactate transferase
MSDQPVRTLVETDEGVLDFQRYFVAEQCRPVARAIGFAGVREAQASPGFARALAREDLAAVLVCPSNPYLSIDPLLALPGVRKQIADLAVPRLAVSPIVGGKAIKGPAAKLMTELGARVDVVGVARHYRGLIDRLMIDETDREAAAEVGALGIAADVAPTVMRSHADRVELARTTLAAAGVAV